MSQPQIKPQDIPMAQWIESRIARLEGVNMTGML